MRNPELCREDEIAAMVHRFYASVRGDPLIGPVFDAHVTDWDRHLARMCDFWSSVLLGTTRYRGTPMPTHTKLPALSPAFFRRWLELFHATTLTLGLLAFLTRGPRSFTRRQRKALAGGRSLGIQGLLPPTLAGAWGKRSST